MSDVCQRYFLVGQRRWVVYGLSPDSLYNLIGRESREALHLSSREVFANDARTVNVNSTFLESEALQVHLGFWRLVK